MQRLKSARPTPALIVAMAALVMALSGAAIALPGKNTVKKNDIAKGAVTGKAIAKNAVKQKAINKNAVRSKQVKGKSLKGNDLRDATVKSKQIADQAITAEKVADATITGKQVADGSLSDKQIGDYDVIGDNAFVKATATDGASEAAARTAAPEVALFKQGQLDVYAKCFRDTTAGATFAEIYIRTSADGALTQGIDNLPGSNGTTLLNTATAEVDRQWDLATVTAANSASYNEAEQAASSPDGTDLHAITHIGVKQGSLPGGNGAFGDGDVCLFGGAITG